MKKLHKAGQTAAITTLLTCMGAACAQQAPLLLTQNVVLSGIEGDFDFLAVDLKRNHLFAAAEEHHSIELFEASTGKHLQSIPGVKTPHTLAFIEDRDEHKMRCLCYGVLFLANGLAPGCGIPVNAFTGVERDDLFHRLDGSAAFDAALATSALSGRIGNDPGALLPAYLAPLQRMRDTLSPCPKSPCAAIQLKRSLLATKQSVAPGTGDHLVELKGPLFTATTFAENQPFLAANRCLKTSAELPHKSELGGLNLASTSDSA